VRRWSTPTSSPVRRAIGRVVFADAAARRDLEEIVHPAVEAGALAELAVAEPESGIVVFDVALLVETDGRRRYALDGVLVVDAPEELCIERLVERRSMTPEDAAARLSAQVPRAERLRAADFIICNLGSLDELEAMVDEAWRWMTRLRDELAGLGGRPADG
jgi:dephospho-CoA kinase